MPENKSKTIYMTTCPGGSNVSILAYRAIAALEKKGHGKFLRLAGERGKEKDREGLLEAKESATQWILVDGCTKGCGLKILENAGIKPDKYLHITDLGLNRENDTNYTPEEFNMVLSAITDFLKE